jgi:hypothetical protein
MFDPAKKIGEDDKGPGLTVVMSHTAPSKYDPSKRIGETPDDTQDEGAGGDPDALMSDLSERLCKAFNVGTDRAPRIKDLLEAFCHAADSKPHAEGKDTEEEEEGN